MKNNKLFALIAFVAVVLTAGCKREAATDKMRVAVSVEPQRWLVEQIGGERVEVSTLLGKNADPENFDPTLGSMKAVEQSKLFIMTGTNAFEKELVKKLGLGDERLVNLSEGIDLLYGTHQHHSHDAGENEEDDDEMAADPHIWASVKNLRVMSEAVKDALSKVDAEGAEQYESNYRNLVAKLDSIDETLTKKIVSKQNKNFMMWHPALSYFARDYGLEQLWIGAEGKELSVKGVSEAMNHAKKNGVELFVVQPSDDRARSAMVAGNAGMRMAEVNSLAYDVAAELVKLVDEMK